MSTRSVAFQVSYLLTIHDSCSSEFPRCLIEILAFLLKNKLIDGNNMTVTGRTLGENLEQWTHKFGELDFQQDLIRPLDNPIKSTGHIRLIYFYFGSKEVLTDLL